jgi:hypothetical protein
MAKSNGKSKPVKLKKVIIRKMELIKKRTFADEWEDSLVTEAWVLECNRNEPSKLRGMYGDYDIGKEETEGGE